MREHDLFVFSIHILGAFTTLFWGVFLFFYRRHMKHNLPFACIFTSVGLFYMFNGYIRQPVFEPVDTYNVLSYIIMFFVVPFTRLYTIMALGPKSPDRKFLLNFIPMAAISAIYLLLCRYSAHIPFCHDIGEMLGYAAQYPLYAAYYLIMITVFTVQILTYYFMIVARLIHVRKIHRENGYPLTSTGKIFAMASLFIFYPLYCMVYLAYNNYLPLTVINYILIAVEVTIVSILSMDLALPIKTEFKNAEQAADVLNMEMEQSEKMSKMISKLFENDKIYKDTNLTLSALARMTGTNRTTLSKFINRHYGKSFNQLLARYRIEAAKKLLANKNFDIQHIPFEAGFGSRASFYRAFDEYVSNELSPAEWRKTIGNG